MNKTNAVKNRGKKGPGSLVGRRNRVGGENLKAGTKAAQKACQGDRTTERTLLRRMLARLETTVGDPLGDLLEKTLDSALDGDKDAMAFIGKYLLGNGKTSLSDLYSPPVIRKG